MYDRCYSELLKFSTFESRLKYLKLDGQVCQLTFGYQRWINQKLYHSSKWKNFKDQIIIRDLGCDLGLEGYEIRGPIYIHHINPLTYDDIVTNGARVFDPENAICVKFSTHNAIHYGDDKMLSSIYRERTKNDTAPWLLCPTNETR